MDFKTGDKVVCIDDKPRYGSVSLRNLFNFKKGITEGKTYTISEVYTDIENKLSILLDGVYNGSVRGHPYFYGYVSDRFVKIDDLVERTISFENITEKK